MDLISVIVPVYNVEKYLNKCLESIINQTYKNLEIILIDDGSTDNSSQICDEWVKKDDRIIVIHKENGGLSSARNAGLDIAKGEYIAFVDSDDYIHPQMYEKLYDSLTKNKANMSICNVKIVDEDGYAIISENQSLPINNEVISGRDVLDYKIGENQGWKWIVVCVKLYSRNLFKDIRFPKGKINEDAFIAHLIYDKCEKIACIKEQLYCYVQRDGSIMNSACSINRLDDSEATIKRITFLINNNYSSTAIYKEYIKYYANLIFVYNNIGKNNKEFKEKYTFLQKQYRNIFWKIIKNDSSVKHRLSYVLSYLSPFVKDYLSKRYLKVRSILSFVKRKITFAPKMLAYFCKSFNKDCILVNTPVHGNLGDHAICIAQLQMLDENDISVFEISALKINLKEKAYAFFTPKSKTVLLDGGGSIGSIWKNEEECIRRIIKSFKRNKIIIFPQTVTFDLDTQEDIDFLKESQEIYSSHPDLTVFVREKNSYEFMKKYFPDVKCELTPDIVTLLKEDFDESSERNGALFCLRSDREKNLTGQQIEILENTVKNELPDEFIECTDTVLNSGVSEQEREFKVKQKLQQFASSKLIVTDRLHGMIFAAITGTPCIALGNSNGKVKNVYEWIKTLDYIKYVDDITTFETVLKSIDLSKKYHYNNDFLKNNFESLFKTVKELK